MGVTNCDISLNHNSSSRRTTHNLRNDIDYMEIVKNNSNEPKRPNLEPQESPTQAIDEE
jgi:hypothetical protein